MKKGLHISLFFAALFLGIVPLTLHFRELVTSDDFYTSRFQRILNNKIEVAGQTIDLLEEANFDEAIAITQSLVQSGYSFQIYDSGGLVFWSDNNLPVPLTGYDSLPVEKVISLQNSIYYVLSHRAGERELLAFILLYNNFPYSNKYLRSGVVPDFLMPKGVQVDPFTRHGKIVYSMQHTPILSLKFASFEKIAPIQRILATIFLYLFVVCLLYYFYWLVLAQGSSKRRCWSIIVLSALVLSIRLLSLALLPKPGWLYTFDPFTFASKYAPSIGDLIVNSIVVLWFCVLFLRFFDDLFKPVGTRYNLPARANLMNAFLVMVIFYVVLVARSLIQHSSIEFLPLGINQINGSTLLGYLAFFLQMLVLVLTFIWRFKYRSVEYPFYQNYISFGVQLLTVALIFHFTILPFDAPIIIAFLLAYPLTCFLTMKVTKSIRIYFFFIALFVSTVFVEIFIYRYASQKQLQHDEAQVEGLANEHDPVAEYFLEAMSSELRSDSVLSKEVASETVDFTRIYDYLIKNYFNGFWKQYELKKISVCNPAHYLFDNQSLSWSHCFTHFDSLVNSMGMQIEQSDFYFLNNYSGRISYLGIIPYYPSNSKSATKINLYIELESNTSIESLGYPELLLDETLQRKPNALGYSNAKYHKNRLISKSGKFEYSSSAEEFIAAATGVFSNYQSEGYQHLIFKPDSSNLVILSKRRYLFLDYAVIFSYLFIFNFIVFSVLMLLFQTGFYRFQLASSFRNRLQFYIVSILVFSLLLLTSSTIMFIIRNHHKNQTFILMEKIQSVYVELDHKLHYQDTLIRNWSADKYENLDQLLIKFSDVFYSDINMYTPNGDLLATSRSEIFNLALKGKKIDPVVYHQLHHKKKPQYLHRENIYQLDYLSAYTPFYNYEGKLLAYLNLPYFSKESDLQASITTLSVTIVNIYIVLILITLVVAFLISNQLTRPLELIKNRLSQLKLGVNYETIAYHRHDEIGSLVEEYNRAAKELERSVELLAKSERESAWREMAKQIAHEIKNPLTPMRLSIQHLQRAWQKNDANFEKYLNQVASTLIEQIDALTTIANEFSNFAKMPQAQVVKVEIVGLLQKCLQLFSSNQNCRFFLETRVKQAYVMADADQLSRVFVNILKNALQAIPSEREGRIVVDIDIMDNLAMVGVTDNGTGIPESIHNKLFQPNFTTKNSGMGLGLAIAKKTIQQFEGEISFTTLQGEGSTFVVELPLANRL